jgi:hypothetical protein
MMPVLGFFEYRRDVSAPCMRVEVNGGGGGVLELVHFVHELHFLVWIAGVDLIREECAVLDFL